ncbi:MAG: biopolymer transporter ExbD [Gammaproteobacteria bacterium]|nr:MAG: biopolymer transporter ExbD [Gammaproteobacteria bacterium]
MNLRTPRREEPGLDLIPLIDVVFMLLIFFMVTTTFNRDSGLQIELPTADVEQTEPKADTIEITIDAEGRYYVNQQALINTQMDTLKRAIEQTAGEHRDMPFIISADAKTPHQAVVSAMDAAAQLGFVRITFATQQAKAGP